MIFEKNDCAKIMKESHFASWETSCVELRDDLRDRNSRIRLEKRPFVVLRTCANERLADLRMNSILGQLQRMRFPFALYYIDGTDISGFGCNVELHNLDKEEDWRERLTGGSSIPAVFFVEGHKKDPAYGKAKITYDKDFIELDVKSELRLEHLIEAIEGLRWGKAELEMTVFLSVTVCDVSCVDFPEDYPGALEYKYGSVELQDIKYRYRVPGWDFVEGIKETNEVKWRKRQPIGYFIAALEAYNILKEGKMAFWNDIYTEQRGCNLSDLDDILRELEDKGYIKVFRYAYQAKSRAELLRGMKAVMLQTRFSSAAIAILTEPKRKALAICKEGGFEEIRAFGFPQFWRHVDFDVILAVCKSATADVKEKMLLQIGKLKEIDECIKAKVESAMAELLV